MNRTLIYWIAFALTVPAILVFLGVGLMERDGSLPDVKNQVVNNEEVYLYTGRINKVSLRRLVKVAASSLYPAYKEYTLYVEGDLGTANVVIRIYGSGEDENYRVIEVSE